MAGLRFWYVFNGTTWNGENCGYRCHYRAALGGWRSRRRDPGTGCRETRPRLAGVCVRDACCCVRCLSLRGRDSGGTELFGAYLAGAFFAHVFRCPPPSPPATSTPHAAFTAYILTPLRTLFSPVFFASVGTALPIRSLVSVRGSHAVVWRGVVYAGVMVLAKAIVGVWMLVWPEGGCARKAGKAAAERECVELDPTRPVPALSDVPEIPALLPRFSRRRSALLLGLAMVARGEIALIVAQLARPLLVGSSNGQDTAGMISEPFAVVIWAILVTTIAGAVAVGWVLRGKQ